MPFRRLLSPIYENGFNTPVGWDPDRLYFGFKKPNPRSVSLELVGTPTITPHHRFSAMLMQWGQFLDHDITFFATALARQTYMTGAICNKTCENVDPCFNIPLPLNDPKRREHRHMKYPCIEFERSAAICGSGETSPIFQQVTHREQVNIITAFIDGSNFLDHDITFFATALARQTYMTGAICNKTCENVDPCFNIPLPLNDPKRREHRHMKYPCIEFERSAAICGSGETSPIFQQVTHREQVNIITAFIDGSNVYGSTEVDALDLRDLFSDHGLLRFDIVSSSQKPYMPFEKDSGMDCRRNRSVANPIRCFLAGDFRANEQLGLTAMHTLWFREHNRIASKLLEMNADWDGERIYQETRKIIGGMMQHITFKHWLPLILGQDGYERWIGEYKGYDSNVDPSISNEFATAAFRFGHTLINPRLERLGKNFETISSGPIMLHEAFFAPERMLSEGGIDPLLRGLFASPLKKPLSHQLLNKELTEKLFHRATDVALDLAAMNIQRGRDHALPGYVEYRRFCNLSVPESWEQLELDFEDQTIISKLRKLYGHPGNLDLWVGGVLEKRLPDALM
uniref:Thyroid peroxidase n=1 Tax=Panagrolaimus sp. JU765 TaxID=591449 RepID=A0AC34R0R0_9BILA